MDWLHMLHVNALSYWASGDSALKIIWLFTTMDLNMALFLA